MINYMNERTTARVCHQTEREQDEFVQVAQPLVEQKTSGCEETEKRFRPDDCNVNPIRDQAALKQISQPQHAPLLV
jgi:hypothetical protein